MKFFTPQLILRGGSLDDVVANAAEVEWEEAIEAYERQLTDIRSSLPPTMIGFLDAYNLHDARVLVLALSEDDQSAELLVQPAGKDASLLSLNYTLAEAPRVIRHQELAEPAAPLEWLYDEVSTVPGSPDSFTHQILLSSGTEVGLTFRQFKVARLHLLPEFSLSMQGMRASGYEGVVAEV